MLAMLGKHNAFVYEVVVNLQLDKQTHYVYNDTCCLDNDLGHVGRTYVGNGLYQKVLSRR